MRKILTTFALTDQLAIRDAPADDASNRFQESAKVRVFPLVISESLFVRGDRHMRLMSFSLTTRQFTERTKTVTRRLGWTMLKPGDRIMGCKKVMGRKRGEELIRLGEIEVVSVRREKLMAITDDDVTREGFPSLGFEEFISFFCKSHKGCTPETTVTRIEFRYI